MPVVLVAVPPHPETAALLGGVADAIATALGLEDGDVIAQSVAIGEAIAAGGATVDAWPVVTVHGSDRGETATRAARDAAADAVRAWADERGVALGGVWVSWIPSAP